MSWCCRVSSKQQKKSRQVWSFKCFCSLSPPGLILTLYAYKLKSGHLLGPEWTPSRYPGGIKSVLNKHRMQKKRGERGHPAEFCWPSTGAEGRDILQPCRRGLLPAICVTSMGRLFLVGRDSERECVVWDATLASWHCGFLDDMFQGRVSWRQAHALSQKAKKNKGEKREGKKISGLKTCMEKTMTLERGRRGNRPLCTPTFHFCVTDDPLKLRRDGRKLCQM